MTYAQTRQTAEDVRRTSAFVALVAEWDTVALQQHLDDMSRDDLEVAAIDLARRYVAERAEVLARRHLVDEDEARRMVRDEQRRIAVIVAKDLEDFDAEQREAEQ